MSFLRRRRNTPGQQEDVLNQDERAQRVETANLAEIERKQQAVRRRQDALRAEAALLRRRLGG